MINELLEQTLCERTDTYAYMALPKPIHL